jgi:hypothetical protein
LTASPAISRPTAGSSHQAPASALPSRPSIVREWLASHDAPEDLATEVARLVTAHEVGGWREADLLQAADSLSFLEVNATRPAAWVRDGRCSAAEARARFREMRDRIAVDEARAPAEALLEDAERRFGEELAAESSPEHRR